MTNPGTNSINTKERSMRREILLSALVSVLFFIPACAQQTEAVVQEEALTTSPEPQMVQLNPVAATEAPPARTKEPEPEETQEPEETPEPEETEVLTEATPVPGKVYLNSDKVSLYGGGSFELELYLDRNETECEDTTWTSSDESVAIVDENGVVVGLKKGSAEITAEPNDGTGRNATCKVTVTSGRPGQKGEIYFGGNVYVVTKKAENDEARHVRKYVESLDTSLPGNKMVVDALHYVSYPYGTESGQIDCSMLLLYTCLDNGIQIPRQSDKQAIYLKEKQIPLSELEPGDFVYFAYPEDYPCSCSTSPACKRYNRIHHCAIYVGETRGYKYFVEASSRVGRVCIRRWDGTPTYVGLNIAFCARVRPEEK